MTPLAHDRYCDAIELVIHRADATPAAGLPYEVAPDVARSPSRGSGAR
ncbi:hypothetical protein OG585_31660 [Streptomyces sp. NBC_01340]|nr:MULTISPECIES: hypothetical protein [unclassified Streptomyces]MCX4457131.1 hypothetical protein [Streptomyces sp. NBC_01719]MCX4496490.1 hypothetical protein [Streptomyces sp. NBC_01728]MCX4588925.1 hypothetical protein [Streptomyces sp. NBC_01549]WSI41394.1 hypothetical protein OG585_31660 [Streptomyces sp. NBC_01340]